MQMRLSHHPIRMLPISTHLSVRALALVVTRKMYLYKGLLGCYVEIHNVRSVLPSPLRAKGFTELEKFSKYITALGR